MIKQYYFNKIRIIVSIVTGILLSGILCGEIKYEDYVPGTIAKAISEQPHNPTSDRWVDAANLKYIVAVTFSGRVRPIQPSVTTLLDDWSKALHLSPDTRSLFQNEILVRETAKDYWLPIQQPVLTQLKKEVLPRSFVALYIMRVGSIKAGPVFVVNEYKIVKKEGR